MASAPATALPNCDNATGILKEDEVTSNNTAISPSLSNLPPLAPNARRIYLLRHGETHWNVQGKIQGGGYDIALNENGRAQALATAQALKNAKIPLHVIASSPLVRAHETARIVARHHHNHREEEENDVISLPGLAEMRFGDFEGMAWRALPETDPRRLHFGHVSKRVKQDVHAPFPGGGESTAQVQARSTSALQQVLEEYPSALHVALVSHGRTNKVLIAATAMGDVMHYPKVKQSNTCINVMDLHEDGTWTIQLLNSIDHVQDSVIVR